MPLPAKRLDFRWGHSTRITLTDAAVLLHHRVVVVADGALHYLDFFLRQHRHDLHDLLVSAIPLKIGHEILHGNAAGRKLRATAAVYNFDDFGHCGVDSEKRQDGLAMPRFYPT